MNGLIIAGEIKYPVANVVPMVAKNNSQLTRMLLGFVGGFLTTFKTNLPSRFRKIAIRFIFSRFSNNLKKAFFVS
jgi:hypothetical protein